MHKDGRLGTSIDLVSDILTSISNRPGAYHEIFVSTNKSVLVFSSRPSRTTFLRGTLGEGSLVLWV
jgi:hypothetical protein